MRFNHEQLGCQAAVASFLFMLISLKVLNSGDSKRGVDVKVEKPEREKEKYVSENCINHIISTNFSDVFI